ncbi:MAG: DUF3990 domain-containing protein [Lonepinella koalarum]|nr:DUF3990 domain-containing protein [Lonepinella koalarum]
MTTLYHGSNVEIQQPKILGHLRALDFGSGFYLTSNFHQAEKWAKLVVKRRQQGEAVVNRYIFMPSDELHILHFTKANDEWLDFVVANRKLQPLKTKYDLVIGPVANDATLPVIDDYMDGRYTKQEAVARLLPQNLTDQYAFLSEKALSFLQFERSEIL